mgnify:CR=1 FL=1
MATQRLPRIAFLPGEGVGPEVVAQARRVLYALRGPGFDFEALDAPPNAVGALATDAWGEPLPPATLALAQSADAVLFGSVGDPRHDHLPVHLRPERAILGLRRGLGLYASLRHIAITGPLEALSPLKAERVRGVDLLVVRELDGDAYTGQPKGQRPVPDGPFAGQAEGFDTMRYAEGEVRRVAHVAFRAAASRRALVTSVDKANVLESSRLWRRVGCQECEGHGYRGRMGIHELMLSDEAIRQHIRRRASAAEIRQTALAAGMLTLRQDGIEKVLHGLTDMSEVLAASNL